MKKLTSILGLLLITFSVFSQFSTVPASSTWTTARGILNNNFLLAATKASPTFTGTVTLPTWKIGTVTITTNGVELNLLDGLLSNATELNYLVGTTAAIQSQLNAKSSTSHTHSGVYEPVLGNPSVTGYVLSSTSTGVRSWIAQSGGPGGGLTEEEVSGMINDSLESRTAEAEVGIAIRDSTGVLQGSYITGKRFTDAILASPKLADTTAIFTVGGGNNLRGCQGSFLPNADLGGFSNTSNKDTIYITSGRFFVAQDSGTVTMGFRFYKHATTYPTSASTDMMSNVITLSSATNATTTGTVITHSSTPHFDVIVLYPGESIAAIATVKSNGNMPKLMRGTIYGYKQNRTY